MTTMCWDPWLLIRYSKLTSISRTQSAILKLVDAYSNMTDTFNMPNNQPRKGWISELKVAISIYEAYTKAIYRELFYPWKEKKKQLEQAYMKHTQRLSTENSSIHEKEKKKPLEQAYIKHKQRPSTLTSSTPDIARHQGTSRQKKQQWNLVKVLTYWH